MSFASPWLLGGLLLLVPLVLLHLRQRGEAVHEVPSLLLWEEIPLGEATGRRGLRWPSLPLLLLLQALALVLLVLAVAQPTSPAAAPKPGQVIVLDNSWPMEAPGRLGEAERLAEQVLAADHPGTPIAIVLAGGQPEVLYRGGRTGARAALARVRVSAAPANLAAALTVAAGLLAGAHDAVTLIRAPEDPLPTVSAGAGALRTFTLPAAVGEQGIFDAGARCGIGATAACEVYATVRNTSGRTVEDRVSAEAQGRPALSLQVRVGPDASAPLVLASQPGQKVSLRLQSGDRLPADEEAWVTVPAAGELPPSSTVTLVGSPAVALATARAFAAVPGVTLELRTRATFRASEAGHTSLLILDQFWPRGALPASPAVLLVDPPRLPGGRVGAALAESAVSGSDAGSELLDGVELSPLSIQAGAATTVVLPRWLAPVVWSPSGVLLAAGDNGSQRVAALSFEPGRSDLPQLPALPILAANLVRWASAWAPPTASAGVPFDVDAASTIRSLTLYRGDDAVERVDVAHAPVALEVERPGAYTVRERGGGVTREAAIAVNTAAAPASSPEVVDLAAARVAVGRAAPAGEEWWFLAAALLALGLEWVYWVSRGRGGGR